MIVKYVCVEGVRYNTVIGTKMFDPKPSSQGSEIATFTPTVCIS